VLNEGNLLTAYVLFAIYVATSKCSPEWCFNNVVYLLSAIV